MPKKIDLKNPRSLRQSLGLNQIDFWGTYGVTQSGGSRYETGRNMPAQIGALIWLHQTGKIDDKALAAALKAARGSY